MGRTEGKAALRRQLDGLEFYRVWRIAGLRQAYPEMPARGVERMVVEPAAAWLKTLDQMPARQGRAILEEVRVWYAHTWADLLHWAAQGAAAREAVDAFLTAYRAQ